MFEALQQMFMMRSQELKGSLLLYLGFVLVQMSRVDAGTDNNPLLAFKLSPGCTTPSLRLASSFNFAWVEVLYGLS